MYSKKLLGNLGENISIYYLINHNYKIICKNFSCRQGEIDIIAKDLLSNELVFFEVKTRTNFLYGRPSDSVNINKKKHILESTKYYIYKNNIFNLFIRIDVIEIFVKNNFYYINHIKQIM